MNHAIATAPQDLPIAAHAVVYLPSVQVDGGDVSTHVDPMAAEVLELLRDHNGQKRAVLRVNRCLLTVAREKAYTMSVHQKPAHVLGGIGPNGLVRKICGDAALPDWYPRETDSNNIESVGYGYSGPQQMVDGWVRSPGHSKHVLGLGEFFAEQIDVAAAVYWDGNGHPWWAFVSAPAQGAD